MQSSIANSKVAIVAKTGALRACSQGRARSAYLLLLVLFIAGGCSSQQFLIRRDTPANPLEIPLQITSRSGPQISQRTQTLFRRYAVQELYDEDPSACLKELQILLESEVDSELVYSISELAYILGKRAEQDDRQPCGFL